MASLLPQFKCPAGTLTIHFRPHHHHNLLKIREPVCFRGQCILSTTTAVVDIEKLRIPSLEAHSTSVAGVRPLTYMGAIGPPTKTNFGAALATETLLTGEEAVIAAAAAEAVALAKVAVEVAKDAALMVGYYPYIKSDKPVDFPSEADILLLERARLTEMERVGTIAHSAGAETRPDKIHAIQLCIEDIDKSNPSDNELELLHMKHSKSTAVRSERRTERRARRARAAEKAAVNVISVKSGSSGRKKRSTLQDIDYSDPLRYLRGTTSTARLLTATEELELSEGIQVLLKLEKLYEELGERCGGQPTFAQWAAAARVDQKTLRKRLNYGILCKDRMIKSNIRLVISIAKNYQGAGMNLQDLVQEGCRGLVRGAEKFDASKGFKFSTYAHWWIKQAVRKSLSDQSRTIRLPFLSNPNRPPATALTSNSKPPQAATLNHRPAVILPGLGNNTDDYKRLACSLEEYGVPTVIAKVSRLDWLRNAAGLIDANYWRGTLRPRPVLDWYLQKVEEAVSEAKLLAEGKRISLIGHSAGGWLARVYMEELGMSHISLLLTLGSPHLPPPKGLSGVFDQTRGLLDFVDKNCARAVYTPKLKYVCIAGRYIQGARFFDNSNVTSELVAPVDNVQPITETVSINSIKSISNIPTIRARFIGQGYKQVCGRSDVWGDGVVPEMSAHLEGALNISLEGVYHSPVGSDDTLRPWYGSPAILEKWIHHLHCY